MTAIIATRQLIANDYPKYLALQQPVTITFQLIQKKTSGYLTGLISSIPEEVCKTETPVKMYFFRVSLSQFYLKGLNPKSTLQST